MKKSILTLVIMVFSSFVISAQTLYPYQDKNGKWGYQKADGTIVISPQFERASKFVDNHGVVAKKVGAKTLYGVIDETGNQTIPIEYDYIDLCHEGHVVLYNGKIDQGLFKKGTWTLATMGGNIVSDEYVTVGPVIDGVAWANKGLMKVHRRVRTMPIVNKKGKQVGEDYVFGISKTFIMNDLFELHADRKPDYSGRWVLIDTDGNEISQEFDMVGEFVNGLAWVYKNGKYGFVNTKGEVVIPIKYRSVQGSPNAKTTSLKFNSETTQVRWVCNDKNELAWIDEFGDIVIDFVRTDGKVSIHKKVNEEMWDF